MYVIEIALLPILPGDVCIKRGYSMDANTHFSGSFLVSISFRESDVSLRYEGSFLTCGCNHLSTNWDIRSVILLQLDMRGLIPSIHPLLEHGSFIGLWFTTLYLFISPVESRCSAAICTGKEAVGS